MSLALGTNPEGKERVKGKASRIQSSRIGSVLMCVRRNAQLRELNLLESTRFVVSTVVMIAVSTDGPTGYLIHPAPLSPQNIQSHEKTPAGHGACCGIAHRLLLATAVPIAAIPGAVMGCGCMGVVVVVVVGSHIQRTVLATEQTTVTQQVSHKPIKCQPRLWSQRGTRVNGSHHGDNPLLRPTGIQIATKSYAALQRFQQKNGKITLQPVLINKSKFLKATHRTKIRKTEIPRSMVVEALSW